MLKVRMFYAPENKARVGKMPRGKMVTLPTIVENFLSANSREMIMSYVTSEDASWDYSNPGTSWSGRYVHLENINNLKVKNFLYELNKEILLNLNIKYPHAPIYAETFQLVRWLPGCEQLPHADGENEDGTKHQYSWRTHASLVYLNDDYEGGSIYFPKQALEIKPVPRTLVFFPGTTEYLHGVRKVTDGVRYTIAGFWTTDRDRRNPGLD